MMLKHLSCQLTSFQNRIVTHANEWLKSIPHMQTCLVKRLEVYYYIIWLVQDYKEFFFYSTFISYFSFLIYQQ